MRGRSTTAAERRFHDLLCSLGCIACRLDGRRDVPATVHHIDGRTKPWAHWLVLPLCAGHHQDGTGAPGLIAVHPFKGEFEATYGRQPVQLNQCLDMLEQQLIEVPPKARRAANGEWARMVA